MWSMPNVMICSKLGYGVPAPRTPIAEPAAVHLRVTLDMAQSFIPPVLGTYEEHRVPVGKRGLPSRNPGIRRHTPRQAVHVSALGPSYIATDEGTSHP